MKYRLTEETKECYGVKLYRIECVEPFGIVKQGELGGWIEKESNLSQFGSAWVFENARVFGNACVYGDAEVSENACVYGDAEVRGNAEVYGDARVFGNACVYGDAEVRGNAEVCETEDYLVFKNNWSSGRYFTWTKSNNMWKVGCFYGTGEELIEKAYEDSKLSGDCYKATVEYVEKLNSITNNEINESNS